jgi:hypothetical protein
MHDATNQDTTVRTHVFLILTSRLQQPALSAICGTKDFISSEILKYVVGKSCNRGFKGTLTKMVLLRKICVHISLLWENLMTTAVLKNHQLIIQTVHALHVYKSEDKDKRAGIIHHIH